MSGCPSKSSSNPKLNLVAATASGSVRVLGSGGRGGAACSRFVFVFNTAQRVNGSTLRTLEREYFLSMAYFWGFVFVWIVGGLIYGLVNVWDWNMNG
jgi:hypothetical protein